MKIGKATVARSAICTSDAERIVVRGKDLTAELIGKVGFSDYFFLLLTGALPDAPTRAVLDATLVAIAEHGLVPSVQAARMPLAAAPDAMQGAVAAGILGCGSVILGASETAGKLFAQIDGAAGPDGDLDARRARGRQEEGPERSAVPRMGIRQPRFRPDRRAHQGRQARSRVDGRYRGAGNYGDDLMKLKQVQNGKWVVVWPTASAARGAKLLVQ